MDENKIIESQDALFLEIRKYLLTIKEKMGVENYVKLFEESLSENEDDWKEGVRAFSDNGILYRNISVRADKLLKIMDVERYEKEKIIPIEVFPELKELFCEYYKITKKKSKSLKFCDLLKKCF
jgi:hypothetical protein